MVRHLTIDVGVDFLLDLGEILVHLRDGKQGDGLVTVRLSNLPEDIAGEVKSRCHELQIECREE